MRKTVLVLVAALFILWPAGEQVSYTEASDVGIIIPLTGLKGLDRNLQGHTGDVLSLSFSPDGSTLASGSEDKTVILWNVNTGDRLLTLKGHSGDVLSVSFGPDGKTMASASSSEIILWNILTGAKTNTLKAQRFSNLGPIAISPDGKTLAGSEDKTVILWNINTGDRLLTLKGHSGDVLSVSFSPDGKTVASGSDDKTVMLWKTDSGERITTLKGHNGDVFSVAFGPNGGTLASAGEDKTIIIWGTTTGNKLFALKGAGAGGDVSSLSYSPQHGRMLASGGKDKTVLFWDPLVGDKIKLFSTQKSDACPVAFSPDGRVLAYGNNYRAVVMDVYELYLSRYLEKGEFETKKAYEDRLKEEFPYFSTALSLTNYDADSKNYEAEIEGNRVLVRMPVDAAKEIKRRKGDVYVEGKLKYLDSKSLELLNPMLVDKATGSKYYVQRESSPAVSEAPPVPPAPAVSPLLPPVVPVPLPSTPAKDEQSPSAEKFPPLRTDAYAIVIGIDYTGRADIPRLRYPSQDAKKVYDILTDPKYGGIPKENSILLLNEQATRSDIIASLRKLKTWEGYVYVYYSGHGAPKTKDREFTDAYLIPNDVVISDAQSLDETSVKLSLLQNLVDSSLAKGVFVALDACFTGGGKSIVAMGGKPIVGILASPDILKPQTEGRVVITSSSFNQESWEDESELRGGIFSHYLLEGLKGQAGKGSLVKADDLGEYVKDRVAKAAWRLKGAEQTPNVLGKGDFLVTRNLEKARAEDTEKTNEKLKAAFENGNITVKQLNRALGELQSGTFSKTLDAFLKEKIDEKNFGALY
ncbi:MAG: caspase family protein [Thermodesulfovibrionales bacterium]|nr:caspase family protein [Thermodesulfovibrionales bacterium]